MSSEMKTPSQIAQEYCDYAVVFAEKCYEKKLTYHDDDVKWVDQLLQQYNQRYATLNEEDQLNMNKLAEIWGMYVGEIIHRNHFPDSLWTQTDIGFGLRQNKDSDNVIFPCAKALKEVENGADDSILSFFKVSLLIFANKFQEVIEEEK